MYRIVFSDLLEQVTACKIHRCSTATPQTGFTLVPFEKHREAETAGML